MDTTIDFNTMVLINQELKKRKINSSVHGLAGCTCHGLRVKGDGDFEEVYKIVNEVLASKFLVAYPTSQDVLEIKSRFGNKDE